ncbi:deoxyribodipyrimidine photo-lyase [Sphingobacterium spiritivorum]|uniref:deoxyribodipyrimidine photo-lyase n=1 Tax=Sphingobacterium spiritivorum TaxID=258 RepID=UPI003DA6B2F1
MESKVTLIWFRNDLRFHDNEILFETVSKSPIIIPVYCFDPRYFSKKSSGHRKTGVHRARFILDAVRELKEKFAAMGCDLMSFIGYPEEIIPRLAAKYEVNEVFHHREVASRETMISENVETALWKLKINLKHFIGHTLYHKEDLPFPIRDIPNDFMVFKKKIERESTVRQPFPTPEVMVTHPHLEKTTIPTLEELGYTAEEIQTANNNPIHLRGGEDEALKKVEEVLSGQFNEQLDYMMLSPYIAAGALSPIYLYHKIKDAKLVLNKKRTEKLTAQLLWRDYFRFMLKKYPNVFFKKNGTGKSEYTNTDTNPEDLKKWQSGQTGHEFIDKAMQFLSQTGNLPSDLKKIVSLFFVQEYQGDWRKGASYFEDMLIDYAPATTYGYWAHYAGVGTSIKNNTPASWEVQMKNSYPNGLEIPFFDQDIVA